MTVCVLYFSRTGNTKRLAEAISDSLESPIFDVATSNPSDFNDFDVLIIGTPVNGSRPAPEVTSFIGRMPEGKGKKTILFCTYAIMKGSTLKIMEKELIKKGYVPILSVSKRGLKLNKADFSDVLNDITNKMKEK
jgi:flavodoxin